jgi:hypothetical protein
MRIIVVCAGRSATLSSSQSREDLEANSNRAQTAYESESSEKIPIIEEKLGQIPEAILVQSEGLSWGMKAFFIGCVLLGCFAFVKYHEKPQTSNVGYSKVHS